LDITVQPKRAFLWTPLGGQEGGLGTSVPQAQPPRLYTLPPHSGDAIIQAAESVANIGFRHLIALYIDKNVNSAIIGDK